MKGLQIAVVLLVLSISSLEALICYHCEGNRWDLCRGNVEVCENPDDLCVYLSTYPRYGFFKGCMSPYTVDARMRTNYFTLMNKCSTDRCN